LTAAPHQPGEVLMLCTIQRIHKGVRICDTGPLLRRSGDGATGMCGSQRCGARAVGGDRGRPQPAAQAHRAGAHRTRLGRSRVGTAGGPKHRRQSADRLAVATTLCRDRGRGSAARQERSGAVRATAGQCALSRRLAWGVRAGRVALSGQGDAVLFSRRRGPC
jgi:hypothetical protein